jgi:methionyl-tRNA synthetase
VNGYLTVNGAKMSKSRGTFITARSWLDQKLDPEALRYYFAGKSNGSIEDVDLNMDDMIAKVNSDLVGKFVNIASRCAGFIGKQFDGKLGATDAAATGAFAAAWNKGDITAAFEARDYSRALREIMRLADLANQYVNDHKPWELARQQDKTAELHSVCSTALTLFRDLARYLKPVLPELVQKAEEFLNIAPLNWQGDWQALPVGHPINAYKHLMTRIERRQIDALIEANRASLAPANSAPAAPATSAPVTAAATTISIDDFAKVDLRVARIIEASHVDGSDKLLRLKLDLAEEKPRQIFAGIKAAYAPETLVGRLTVVVANLAPRKMKFGVSEGMALAASDPNGKTEGIYLLSPDSGAVPGMKIK